MKTVTFDQARIEFDKVFQLAAKGEIIVIHRDAERVTLRRVTDSSDLAPPGYFAGDYSPEDIADLNALASQTPQIPLP